MHKPEKPKLDTKEDSLKRVDQTEESAGLSPDDPDTVNDVIQYLAGQGLECTKEEAQELLRRLRATIKKFKSE